MKRSSLLAASVLAFAACGPAQIVVTAEVETMDPVTGTATSASLSDLELQLVPFNRDMVFDSMTNAFETPEPEIPQDLIEARDEIAAAQQRWRTLENRWNTLRDTLQTLGETLENLSRGSGEYRVLFNEYNDLEGEYLGVESQVEDAFEEFDTLQKASIGRSQEIRIQRDNWADEAYAEVDGVFAAKIAEAGLPQAYDTTDATGVAIFDVPPGDYYVVGWYEEVYTELYWNVPVTVVKGEPATITLTRANASERPKL